MIFNTNIFSQKAFTPAQIVRISIKTSAQCGVCKDRLERAMAYENGVVSSDLNLNNKVLTVNYKPSKTTPEQIRKVIIGNGYDADGFAADPSAYAKLPQCSKKPENPLHADHSDKLPNL